MKKMGYTFPLSFLCLDVCATHAIRLAQLSPVLVPHPLLTLWGAGLARALLLILLTLRYPGSLPWMRSFSGLQSLAVLCFLFPAHYTLLWTLGWCSTVDVLGCHCWERVGHAFCTPASKRFNAATFIFSVSPLVLR